MNKLPTNPDQVDPDCGHDECRNSLFSEITRFGCWPNKDKPSTTPEDICLVAERMEDDRAERCAEASGEYQNHYGRKG